MDTIFPAEIEVIPGEGVMLRPRDGKRELWEFCKKREKWEEKKGQEVLVEAELRVYYRRRTAKANRLQWAICRRILKIDGNEECTVEEIHDALKQQFYPSRLNKFSGEEDKKDGKELNTVEYAKVVELFAAEAIKLGAEIRDIWILFTDWRWQQERDPLEGSYSSFEEYRELHPCCEACGKFLLKTNEAGEWINSGEGAHIVGRREGIDDDWNRFILCGDCHRGTQHQKGWEELIKMYPWIGPKCQKAWARSGKKDKSGDMDPVEEARGTAPLADTPSGDQSVTNDTIDIATGEIQETFEIIPPEKTEEEKRAEFEKTLERLGESVTRSSKAVDVENSQEAGRHTAFDANPSRHRANREIESDDGERDQELRGEGVGAKDGTSPVAGKDESQAGPDSSSPESEQRQLGIF